MIIRIKQKEGFITEERILIERDKEDNTFLLGLRTEISVTIIGKDEAIKLRDYLIKEINDIDNEK